MTRVAESVVGRSRSWWRVGLLALAALGVAASAAQGQSKVLGFVEQSSLKFIDTAGVVLKVLPVSATAQQFSVSDDGSRIVYSVAGAYGGSYVLWQYDIASGTHTQLFSQDWCQTLAWLPGSNTQFIYAGPNAALHRYDVPSRTSALWQSDDTIISQFGLGVYRAGIAWDVARTTVLASIGADAAGGNIVVRGVFCEADASHHLCNLQAFSPTYGGSGSWANVSYEPAIDDDGGYGYYIQRINWTEHRLVRKSLTSSTQTVLASTTNNSRGLGSPTVVSATQVAVLAPVGTSESAIWLCSTTPGPCTTVGPALTGAGHLEAVPRVGAFGSWVAAPVPGTLQLSAAAYAVGEGAGSVTVTVTRGGGSAGVVGATLSTVAGTAVAGTDFTPVSRAVSFAAGDTTPQSFQIPILDNGEYEGSESFSVTLSGPTGGATLDSPSTAVVTIADDDQPTFGTRYIYLAEGGRILQLDAAGRLLGAVPTSAQVGLHMFDVSEDGSKVLYCSGGDTGEIWLLEAVSGTNRKLMAAPWCGTLEWLPGSRDAFVFNKVDGRLYRHDIATAATALWQDVDTLAPWPVNTFRGGLEFDASGTRIVFRAGTGGWGNDMVVFGWACANDAHHVCQLQGATPPGQDWQRISFAPAISASGSHIYYLKRHTTAAGEVVRRRLPATVGGVWGAEELLEAIPAGAEQYLAALDLFDDTRLLYVGPNAAVNGWTLYACPVTGATCDVLRNASTWVSHVAVGPALARVTGPEATEVLVADGGRIHRLSPTGQPLGLVGTAPAVPVMQFDVTPDGSRVAYCSGGDPGQLWVLDVATGQNRLLRSAPWCSLVKWLPGSGTRFLFTLSDGRVHQYDLASDSSAVWQDIDVLAPFGLSVYRHGMEWDQAADRVVIRGGQAYGGGDRVLYGRWCSQDAAHHLCDLQALTGPGSGWNVIGFGPEISSTGTDAYYLKRLSLTQGQIVRRPLPNAPGGPLAAEQVLHTIASGAERYLGELHLFDDSRLLYVGEATGGGAWAVKLCTIAPFSCTDLHRSTGGVNQVLVTRTLPAPATPALTVALPRSGPTSGGTTVVVNGRHLAATTRVTVGGVPATITAARDTGVTILTPPGVAGARDVVATVGATTVTLAGGFEYLAPAVIGDQRPLPGPAPIAPTLQPSLSSDGRYLAFASASTEYLGAADTNGVMDVFVRDRASGHVTRVSVGPGGAEGDGPSERPRVSATGRFVAFTSAASNLVYGDTNDSRDVFVHDRDTDADGVFDEPGAFETFRVSVASDGRQADGPCAQPDLSPDGYWVAFVCAATSLLPGGTRPIDQVYLHHWPSRLTRRISVGLGGSEPDGPSRAPALSGAARVVVFASDASNLVPHDANGERDVFMYDHVTGELVRVSTAVPAQPLVGAGVVAALGERDADGASDSPSIDDEGERIAFETSASDVVSYAVAAVTGTTQVVVIDLKRAIRHLVSQALSGGGGNGHSNGAEISGDGAQVAFNSSASDLVPDDGNQAQDVFVAALGPTDGPGTPARVSLDREGDEARRGSGAAALSTDGQVVAFESEAGLTATTEHSTVTNVFVRGVALAVTEVTPPTVAKGQSATVELLGAGFADGVSVTVGGVLVSVQRHSSARLVATVPASGEPGPRDIVVANPDGQRVVRRGQFTVLDDTADTDLDGLPDAWERQFGLDGRSAAGQSGRGGDPDGDGLTNEQELARGTHPRGTFVGYFSEGATSAFFETEIGLANGEGAEAHVLLRFQGADGQQVPWPLTIPGRSARRVRVGAVPGMATAEFSTVVESDVRLSLTRTMTWDKGRGYGSHSESAVTAASRVWYFAEGSTNAGFQLFYLVQNPNDAPATVDFTFLLPAGAPVVRQYTIEARSRFNVWVNRIPELAGTDMSALVAVSAGGPVIVERAMYLDDPAQSFGAGHESAGVTAPAREWFLAEGATGPYFDLFVLLANPDPSRAARVTASYLLPSGTIVRKVYEVAPQSRRTIWVDGEDAALADTAVSTTVSADVPILVERAMWWPGHYGTWHEAHNSFGATVTGTLWGVGGGLVDDDAARHDTYVLIANTSSHEARVLVNVLFDDGTPAVAREFLLAPTSRFNVDMRREFGASGVVDRGFGVTVESLPHAGRPPAQIVVEEAMYNDALGSPWAAGSNALATRLR